MDTVTHLAIGAVIGEAMVGKKIGKKALAIGAVAQFLPDIDVVAALWLAPAENLLAHRGFTHSFLFAAVTAVGLALLAHRWQRLPTIPFKEWLLFFVLQLTLHDVLDAFNAYGVGWFEPFNSLRISWNTLFVADPLFSLWPGVAVVALLFLKHESPSRWRWVTLSLVLSGTYLAYTLFNKYNITQDVKKILGQQHIEYHHYFSTPTPLNNWLWFVVAEDQSGYHVGYRSVFDVQPNIHFEYFPRQDSLLETVHDQESLQHLLRFSQGYYTVEHQNEKLVFNDLRFGQMAGWHNPKAKFVFYYYLHHPEDNMMVIQRGRFANWNKETTRSLLKRIKGN
jgi:inner membrane protein